MPPEIPDPAQTPPPSNGWELACEGILRTEFGRRPASALARAVAQLSAAERRTVNAPGRWWLRIRQRAGLVFAVASAMIFAAAGWFWWHARTAGHGALAQGTVATVAGVRDARWAANSRQLKIGDALQRGPLQLDAGVVELDFTSGARVAVEGPVRLELTGAGSLDLREGKLAAEVPRPARGFTVRTARANVVDLGTRFGVSADADNASRVDVFEGRVQLTAGNSFQLVRNTAMIVDQRGASTTAALGEGAYPQPDRTVFVRPQNCGFDARGAVVLGGVPGNFGSWSGPAYVLATAGMGVRPAEGSGMLRFLDPAPRRPGGTEDSEVWQLIDLRPTKELFANGDVELKSIARFNRIRAEHAATRFGFTIAAFRGAPADMESMWKRRADVALLLLDQELASDDNPETWEKIELSGALPAAADFLVVQVRAIRPDKSAGAAQPFPGHFADWVDVYLNLPLRGSAAAR